MKKLYIALSIILPMLLVFTACTTDTEDAVDKTVSVSGDLAYYAEMSDETRAEKCKGNYIEVTAAVDTLLPTIKKIYFGNILSDGIRISCNLLDSADIEDIQAGDTITIQGKCTSCIGSSIYIEDCEIVNHTQPTDPSTDPSTDSPPDPTPDPAPDPAPTPVPDPTPNPTPEQHTHTFSAATCTTPKTCSCGATEGSANGHSYVTGTCTRCGTKDPNYSEITYILNSSTKKFHRTSCSRLPTENRVDSTLSRDQIVAQGYSPCGYCHP